MQIKFMLWFLIFFSCLVSADYDEASVLYEKKDFVGAFTEFKRLAELGIHDAQYSLGVMHLRGEGIESSPVEAYAWMSLAIEQRDTGVDKFKASINKIYSSLDKQQSQIADKRLEQLIELFGKKAISVKLAPVLMDNQAASRARPLKKISPRYPANVAMDGGMGTVDLIFGIGKDGAVRDVGVLNFSDKRLIGVTVEAMKAWQFEPVKIDGRPVEAYGQTQRFVFQLNNVHFDDKKVLKHIDKFRELAEKGGPIEQYNYAVVLEVVPSYTNVKIDGRDAIRWYYSSASSGNPRAQFSLGKNMLYGQSCAVDAVRSAHWLELAANQNVPDAQYLLAIEMLSGVRLARNEDAAVRWLQKASDANFPNAQLKLAWIYATHPNKDIRNGRLAEKYANKVPEDIFDKRTYFEVRAAVAAENGDFEGAVKWQEKARSEMEKYELPLISADEKLKTYTAKRAWVEEL